MRLIWWYLLIASSQFISCQRGKQTRCKTAPTLPKKVERVINLCQEEVKYQLIEEHKLNIPKEALDEENEQHKDHYTVHDAHENQQHNTQNYVPQYYYTTQNVVEPNENPETESQEYEPEDTQEESNEETETDEPIPVPVYQPEAIDYQIVQEQNLDYRIPNPHAKLAAHGYVPLRLYNQQQSTVRPTNLEAYKRLLRINVKKRQTRQKRRLNRRLGFSYGDEDEEEEFFHLTLLSQEEKWVAGCLMQCIYRRNDAVDHHGWPTLDGLVDLYTDGVHEQKYFMNALRSVDFCLKGASKKHKVHRNVKPDAKASLCYVAFDVFDCISDKILEYCTGSDP